MKKFLYLLFALPLMAAGFVSCSDDDDTPDVSMNITLGGSALNYDGEIYLVSGDSLIIESVNITNNEAGKKAAITMATYFWNGYRLGSNGIAPYGFGIATERFGTDADGKEFGTVPGEYVLQIVTPVLAEDKSLATAVLSYIVNVVAEPSDMPEGTGTRVAQTQPSYRE